MFGKIYITRYGYDPQFGKHIKDPYLGDIPSMGACRPEFRKKLDKGDQIFVISGRVRGIDAKQFVMGGFEVSHKINAIEAYKMYPDQRLRRRPDGQLVGNIIVTENGDRHPFDDHKNFTKRLDNYIVGSNPIVLKSDAEIERGRSETMDALQEILKRRGERPIDIITRAGVELSEKQVFDFREWLDSIKTQSA